MLENEKKQHFKIFSPTSEDWVGLRNLRLEALQNDPQAFGVSYEDELKISDEESQNKFSLALGENPKEILLFAKDGEKYVGMIGAFRKNDDKWNLKAMYVKPEYRGTGISKELVAETLRRITADPTVAEIILSVNAAATPAVKLYQSFGFKIIVTVTGSAFGDGKEYDKYEMKWSREA